MDNEIVENSELLSEFLIQYSWEFTRFLETKIPEPSFNSSGSPFDAKLDRDASIENLAEQIISQVIKGEL